MSLYGNLVQQHWAKYRPTAWAAMDPRRKAAFVRQQAAEIERRVGDRVDEVETALPPGLPYQEKLSRVQTAQALAESEVLREMLPRAEVDETETYLATDDR